MNTTLNYLDNMVYQDEFHTVFEIQVLSFLHNPTSQQVNTYFKFNFLVCMRFLVVSPFSHNWMKMQLDLLKYSK